MDVELTTPARSWGEIQSLLARNHAETGVLNPEDFGPRYETYDAMHRAGALLMMLARHRGSVAGYGAFLTVPHCHYPDTRWAHQDALYIAPEVRGYASGSFLLSTERALEDAGVDVILRHQPYKRGVDLLGRAYRRMGYRPAEIGFIRDLREKRTDGEGE